MLQKFGKIRPRIHNIHAMQKNIESILVRLLKLALSAVVLFFVTTAIILASVRLWLGPELIKFVNDSQKLETFLSRFEEASTIDLTLTNADLSWEKWLIPELKISKLTISNKEDKLNIAILENLKVSLGARSLIKNLLGETAFDLVYLDSLKIYLKSNWNENLKNVGFKNSHGSSKALLILLKNIGRATIGKTEIVEVYKNEFWKQNLLLKLGSIDLEQLDEETYLTFRKVESEELLPILKYFDLAIESFHDYRFKGMFEEINFSFRGNHFVNDVSFDSKAFLNGLVIKGLFSNISIEKMEKKLFYLNNLAGDFVVKEGSVKVKIGGSEGILNAPKFFPSGELYFSGIEGELQNLDFSFHRPGEWETKKLIFNLENFKFENPDLVLLVNGDISLLKGEVFSKVEGDILFKDPQVISHYLPNTVGPKTRNWMKRAFLSGETIKGTFEYSGVIGKPHIKKNRKVKFNFFPTSLNLLFSEKWPAISSLRGEVEIEGRSLKIKNASGDFAGNKIGNINGQISNMKSYAPVLKLNGILSGDLQRIINSANKSPVERWLKNFTTDMKGRGSADLDLFLTIDLKNFQNSDVFGKLTLKNNEISLKDFLPELTVHNGEVIFSKNKLVELDLKGTSLGGNFSISDREDDGSKNLNLAMTGAFDSHEFVKWFFKIRNPYKSNTFKGVVDYKLDINFQNNTLSVLGYSDLVMLGIDVPHIYTKISGEKSNLFLEYKLNKKADNVSSGWALNIRSPREKFALLVKKNLFNEFGNKDANSGSTYYKLHIGDRKNTEDNIIKSVEERRKIKDNNIVSISTDNMSLDKLYNFVKTQKELFTTSGNAKLFNNSTIIDVSSKKVVWQNNEFRNFKGLFFMGLDGLSGDVKADQASGKVTWYRDTETIDLDFEKLELKRILSVKKSSNSNIAGNDIGIPITLKLKVDEFTNKFGKLGKIKLSISSEPELKTWFVRDLSVFSDDFQLFASGFWKIVEDPKSYPLLYGERTEVGEILKLTEINFRLETDNIQALMDKVGYPGLFGQAEGILSGQLAWAGNPLNFNLENMYGGVYADILDGKFIPAEPGLGRLIGLFNLQSLSKRLKLDFGDVFSEGFSFDRVRGDIKLERGVAQTSNLRVLGTQATVFLEGFIDLGEEKQDLRVLVLPNFNAGLASLGYVLVNPAVGLGSFLAQYILRDPLQKILAFEYKISGNLYTPEVEKNSLRSFNQSKQLEYNETRKVIE